MEQVPNENNGQVVTGPAMKLTVKHAFGCHITTLDPILSYSAASGNKDYSDRLLRKIGKHVCVYDPETGIQEYFDSGRPRNVFDVNHFTVSTNGRFIAMCEQIRSSGDGSSQISVYSLGSMNRLKTLHHNTSRPYICSTFCGDPKQLAALTDEPERCIVVWYWEKEKFYKAINVGLSSTSILRSAPCTSLMLTSSGQCTFRSWSLGPDGSLKASNLVPPAKECLEYFIDHHWLPVSACPVGVYRLVALADPDPNNEINRSRKQTLYILQGSDLVSGASGSSNVPIQMELKQFISLKLENGCHAERIVPFGKAFLIIGSNGLVCTYERTDDKHEPFVEARRLALGNLHLSAGTVYPSEEKAVFLTSQGRLLTMQMDATVEQLKQSDILKPVGDELPGYHTQGDPSDEEFGKNVDAENSATSGGRKLAWGKVNSIEKSHQCLADLNKGGYHCTAVLSADLAKERPLLATVGADGTVRVWNYVTGKCEIVQRFNGEDPLACAFHSSGFQILISFKDRIRLYHLLLDRFKKCKETVLKNCKCLKFSHGSQYWAAASGINVVIYDTRTFQQLTTFQGHLMTVVRLAWAPGDQVIFSAGMEGGVYGWPISQDGRVDVLASNNRASLVLDLSPDCRPTTFNCSSHEGEEEGSAAALAAAAIAAAQGRTLEDPSSKDDPFGSSRSMVVVSSQDGHLRMPSWSISNAIAKTGGTSGLIYSLTSLPGSFNTVDGVPILYGESGIQITAIQLSSDRNKLFVGTSTGSIRVYPWPPDPQMAVQATQIAGGPGIISSHNNILPHHLHCYEVFVHGAAVVSLSLGGNDTSVVSTAADGTIFIHNFTDQRPLTERKKGGGAVKIYDPFDNEEDNSSSNNDVILMTIEDIEDYVANVLELQKLLTETKAKSEFSLRKLELDHNDSLKRVSEVHDQMLTRERDAFEKQRGLYDKRIRELMSAIETKDVDHVKIITELENKYEHKLAEQLERYDLLSERMQLLKQKCEGLLEAEKNNFQKQINQLKSEASANEKKLRTDNRRAVEDKTANESSFREIITQQEEEYEDELKQLIRAAESELIGERETITKLRALVQAKQTKFDQLRKKFEELQKASKARYVMWSEEKAEKQRLLDTIEHYKKNLQEREDALSEKEKTVLELRTKTRTLENFRFVLDHRLQQLSSERGPITSHIEGLEKHIATMYEELVEEFSSKKASAEASSLKDQKLVWLSQDLSNMRQSVREKEQYIAAFKREVGNIVSSMVVGKELEESVKILYKKFVRGEETAGKTRVKMNPKVADAVNELVHGKTHHAGPNGESADDQSFLSLETSDKGASGRANSGAGKGLSREIESALVDTAKEADRQKKFVERQSRNLKHRLHVTERESHQVVRHRLHENSDLLFECNDLRVENRELQRKIGMLNHDLEAAHRVVHEMKMQALYSARSESRSKSRGNSPKRPESSAGKDASFQKQSGAAIDTAIENADWVVHNSLPTNGHVQKPGSPVNQQRVRGSQSMPSLIDKEKEKGASNENQVISKSQSALQVLEREKLLGKDGKKNGSRLTDPTKSQLERMTSAVESLAQQLDESLRERDMQRMELSRLRKQLMNMSLSQAPHAEVSASASNLMLPSIASSSSAVSPTGGIMHADLHGYPSEEDKQQLRINAGSILSSASARSNSRGGGAKRLGSGPTIVQDSSHIS